VKGDVDVACYGISFPMWMTCKGFSTVHNSIEGGKVCTDMCLWSLAFTSALHCWFFFVDFLQAAANAIILHETI
jgi:hypothetical protein